MKDAAWEHEGSGAPQYDDDGVHLLSVAHKLLHLLWPEHMEGDGCNKGQRD